MADQDELNISNEPIDDDNDNFILDLPPSKRLRLTNRNEINENSVRNFLAENPHFLDNYVQQNVSSVQIERWISTKSNSQTSTSNFQNDNNQTSDFDVNRKILTKTISTTTTKSMSKLVELNDQRRILHELTDDVNQNVSRAQILFELSKSIASTVSASGFNLYLVDETGDQLRLFNAENDDDQSSSLIPIRIEAGRCLSSYVAWSKKTLRLSDSSLIDLEKFPDGVYVRDDQISAVMAHPIISANGTLLGVVEFYRTEKGNPFSEEDEEEILKCVNEFFTQTYYELYHSMTRERRLNDFLLAVTKSIFQELVSMDAVMLKIMSYAKKLVDADRASLFLVDSRTKELYARIFDIGKDEQKSSTDNNERACIRFPMDKGIAGYVATTGKTLNIVDAYSDERFNPDIDHKTGYKTKTLLCMPIMIQGNVIGVVQMVNKKVGHFNKSDEESFETFSVYCGLALHHASLYDRIRRSEQKCKVALEVLSYHASCTDDEYERYKSIVVPEKIAEIDRFDFSPWNVDNENKPIHVLYMFLDLAKMDSSLSKRFDLECVMRFILTVRKNYRNVPYHNWSHAFSVANAIYTVIKQAQHRYTTNQCIALFVACLCHDLDHRGKTNAYMVKSASTLASIYTTSTMERHHFNQTVTILQTENHNIFKHFSPKEYRNMLDEIRHCILSTDLALFFENRPKLERIVDNNQFDWNNKDHLLLVMGLSMTAADLCSSYKQWEVQRSNVSIIMEEFFQQGDDEKRRGLQPQSLMDRSLAHELPKNQVNFIRTTCLPCYSLIGRLLPQSQPMFEGAKSNLQRWQELADEQENRTNSSTNPS